MANKEDLTLQLNELGQKLGRSLSTAGTNADLELRIREAREELDALSEPTPGAGSESGPVTQPDRLSDSTGNDENAVATTDERVCVRVLKTLHLQAWHPVTGRPVRIAVKDSEVLVNASESQALRGLVVVAG